MNDVALVNHPRVESLVGWVTDDGVELRGELSFMNQSAANAGADIQVYELPANVDETTNRLLFFRQIPNPRGLPDIFQPARVEFRASLPLAVGPSNLIVLNSSAPDEAAFGARTTQVCKLGDPPAPTDHEGLLELLVVNPLVGRSVPWLTAPHVEMDRRQHTVHVKLISTAKSPAGDSASLETTIFRQAAYDKGPEVDYVLLTAAAAAATAESPMDGAIELDVSFELSRASKHRLVLLNPVEGAESNADSPFYARDLDTR